MKSMSAQLAEFTGIEISLAVKNLESVSLWYQTYLGFKKVFRLIIQNMELVLFSSKLIMW